MSRQNEFDLPCGHHIRLVALDQSFTEEGRLEGLPTKENNRRRLEWLAEEITARMPQIGCLMIPPTETLIPWDDATPYPFGTPASLPQIKCIGRFKSFKPARDTQADFSQLVVVWFQDHFALPIDGNVAEQIAHIDWTALATDSVF